MLSFESEMGNVVMIDYANMMIAHMESKRKLKNIETEVFFLFKIQPDGEFQTPNNFEVIGSRLSTKPSLNGQRKNVVTLWKQNKERKRER